MQNRGSVLMSSLPDKPWVEYTPNSGTDLAKLVIEVLDAQKRYFKTRKQEDLIASKQLEKELRDKSNAILETA